MRIHTPLTRLITFISTAAVIAGCSGYQTPAQPEESVTVINTTEAGYELVHNGEPYTILGVGGVDELAMLKEYGGNTIRTWDAEGIEPLMDEAHELGIAVVVGIWLEHARHGFDYTEPEAKAEQLARVERFVKQFRDHPALLAWGVGNEVELGGTMDQAIMQINDASALIKELDPNHPTMAVIAEIGDDKAIRIQNECPNIDMIGINSYGGLGNLSKRVQNQGVTLPYAITEFGPVGHWETGNTLWGAPYEQSSSDKAEFIKQNYEQTIQANLGKQCLGSFAFLWGHKQEKTATWYGLLLPTGETTQSVDVLSELWTGQPVENGAPHVKSISIDGMAAGLTKGQPLRVSVDATDPDGDPITTQWELVSESTVVSAGGDKEEAISPVEIEIAEVDTTSATLTLPIEPGAYRIFVTVRDGQGHAGTANLPVYIAE
ncbi:MAG: glycoside hydrolase family 2 TIM barrel-domain containing protein [Phycisphaerales bacterium]